MSRRSRDDDYGDWAPYVPVAERRHKAALAMEKRRKAGHPVSPVSIAGRLIAATFWGKAWCDNMESYAAYANRLPRGRTYVRAGAVVDLQIAEGRVAAFVAGSELYSVEVTVKTAPEAAWRSICADCAGGIDSLVALLQGRLSQPVMERLCRQNGGLFPRPAEIRFSCSCPDGGRNGTHVCKHVAAVMYGIGARFDSEPALLFRLRGVDHSRLLAGIDAAAPLAKAAPAAGRVLAADDVAAVFGLEWADETASGVPAPLAGSAAKDPGGVRGGVPRKKPKVRARPAG